MSELEWMPIDTAPKDEVVIVWNPDPRSLEPEESDHVLLAWRPAPAYEWATVDGEWGAWLQPTHWMPLPDAPEPAP